MSTSNDYKGRINILKQSIADDNKKLQSLKRSGGSDSEIELLKGKLKKNQAALNNVTSEYNDYTQKAQAPESSGISSIAEGITKSVEDAVNNTVGAVTNAVTNTVNNVTNTVNNAVNTVNNVANKVTDSVNKVKNIGNTLSNIKGAIENKVSEVADKVLTAKEKLENMVSDAKDSISNLFNGDKDKNKENADLASKNKDKGPKETQTKVESISPNEHSAMAQPVSYVSKKITTVVENTKSAPSEQKKDDLPTKGPLAKEVSKLGKAASWTKVITNVTDSLKSGLKSVSNFVRNVKSTIMAPINAVKNIKNTAKSLISSVVSDVTSSVLSFTTPIVSGVSDVIKCGTELTNEVTSLLPGPLAAHVSAKTNAFFNKVTNKITNSKLIQVQNVLTKLNAVSESGNLTKFVGTALLAQVGKKYPNLTDGSGLDITHMFGGNSTATINEYMRLMKELCPQIADMFPENGIVDYSVNKTFFDSLLASLAGDGVASMLKQLATCEAANKLYYDDASTKTLMTAAKDVVARGDLDTYGAIASVTGTHAFSNPFLDLNALSANTSEADAASKGSAYCDLVSMFGHTPNNVCVDTALSSKVGATVYKGSDLLLNTHSNNTLLASALDYGKENKTGLNDIQLCKACYFAASK